MEAYGSAEVTKKVVRVSKVTTRSTLCCSVAQLTHDGEVLSELGKTNTCIEKKKDWNCKKDIGESIPATSPIMMHGYFCRHF